MPWSSVPLAPLLLLGLLLLPLAVWAARPALTDPTAWTPHIAGGSSSTGGASDLRLDLHCCVEQAGPGAPFWSTTCCCAPPLEAQCDRAERACKCEGGSDAP